MADIIPPGYCEVSLPIKHAALARSAYVTWGLAITDVPTVAVANSITDCFDVSFGTRMDNETTFGPSTLRVGQDGGEALVVVGSTTDTGDVNQESISANCALLVHKRTSRGGRRGRGRMYVPWCLPESSLDQAGRILSAELALLQTEADDFLAALIALPTVDAMVVLHSESRPPESGGPPVPSIPGLPNVVTSLQCDAIIGTQRRRLGR